MQFTMPRLFSTPAFSGFSHGGAKDLRKIGLGPRFCCRIRLWSSGRNLGIGRDAL